MGDVSSMQYADFIRVTKTSKPYRGTNAYPVGSRRYSHRHFVMNGDVVQVWDANLRMAEEYRKGVAPLDHWSRRRHLVNIHPDNTVEFVSVWGIGDGMFLSNLLGGLVHSEARRGGTVFYPKNNPDLVHPVFKGLRVSLTDGSAHPDMQYKLVYRRIIPSEKKKAMGALEAQLDVGFAMLRAMDLESMKATWKELNASRVDKDSEVLLGDAIRNNHCLDVLVYMSLSGSHYWAFEHGRSTTDFIDRVERAVRKSEKAFISAQPQVFKYIEREVFDFPSATWGMKVKVGDTIVERL